MSNGPSDSSAVATAGSTASRPVLSRTAFHLTAGLFSGFCSAILLQPADLLKTRVQQSRSNSLLATLRQILSSPQPVRQLWRGTLPSTIRTSVGSALYFTSLNALRTRLAALPSSTAASSTAGGSSSSSVLPRLSASANLMSGAVARASVGFVMMPVTVLKVRYESSLYSSYRSLGGAARAIYTAEGVKGFFAGFGATAIRDAPYAGLYVLFYEWGKRGFGELLAMTPVAATATATATTLGLQQQQIEGPEDDKQKGAAKQAALGGGGGGGGMKSGRSAMVNFAAGALAASAATAATNPPDAVKTRLQLRPDRYRNTVQAARLMLQEEGLRSMFDGLGLRMARKAMSSALAWTLYEEVVRRAESRLVLGL